MIEQLETHPTIINKEKLEIRSAFFAPWYNAPDMNLGEYVGTLEKRQRTAKKLRVNIYDKDKTTHFIGCTQHSDLFEDEWMQKWETTIDRDWTVVCNIWVKKYREVTRAMVEVYLEKAVDLYGVATIVANTDHQYLAKKQENYVG